MKTDKLVTEKVNLQKVVDVVPKLYQYLEVGRLNSHVVNVLQVENRTVESLYYQ